MKNGLPLVSCVIAVTSAAGTFWSAIRCEQLLHGRRVEAGERDLLVARLARQRAEGVAQRVLAVDLDVAVGAEHEQPPAPGKARHVAQHRHGPVIRPVQIVDHHHRGRAGRQRQEPLHHGVEQPHPLFVRLQRHRLGQIGEPLAQLRHQSRQRGGAEPEVGPQGLRRRAARVLAQRLGERPVRPRRLALVAAAPEHRRPLGARRLGQLLQRAGLADARLAFQQHHRAVAGAGVSQALAEPRQLRRAADERRLRQQRRRLVLLVRHLVRRDRVAKPLSSSAPTAEKRNACRPRSSSTTTPLHEDLPRRRLLAQPPREHHRRADVVRPRPRSASPTCSPMRSASRSPAARRRAACCIVTAQRTASATEANVVISPSPSHFTSWPPCAATVSLSRR